MAEQTGPFTCPCCGFPSLPSTVASVCSICWWEVDMMGRPANEPCRGPNHGYSLDRACENFRDHGHMYDLGRATAYLESPGQGRLDLMAYVLAVVEGSRRPDQAELDRLIAKDRQSWPWRDAPEGQVTSASEEEMLRALLRKSGD